MLEVSSSLLYCTPLLESHHHIYLLTYLSLYPLVLSNHDVILEWHHSMLSSWRWTAELDLLFDLVYLHFLTRRWFNLCVDHPPIFTWVIRVCFGVADRLCLMRWRRSFPRYRHAVCVHEIAICMLSVCSPSYHPTFIHIMWTAKWHQVSVLIVTHTCIWMLYLLNKSGQCSSLLLLRHV